MNRIISLAVLLLFTVSCRFVHSVSAIRKITQTEIDHTGHEVIRLPFDMVGGHIIARMKIGHGQATTEALFIFDSGATSLISTEFARSQHFTLSESAGLNTRNYTSEEQTANSIANDIYFDLSVLKVTKPYLLTSDASKMLLGCRNAAGIIGSDILSLFGVLVDFEHQEILLYDKQHTPPYLADAGNIRLSFYEKVFQHIPIIENVQAGSYTGDFIWDMGNTGSVIITLKPDDNTSLSQLIAHHTTSRYESYGAMRGISGSDNQQAGYYQYPTDSLQQTGQNLLRKNTPITVRFKNKVVYPGNIGLGVMKSYRKMFIDWEKKTISLQPYNTRDTTSYTGRDIYLSYNDQSNAVVISAINVASALYANGLRAGMHVSGINGLPIAHYLHDHTPCEIDDIVRNQLPQIVSLDVAHNNQPSAP